MFKTGNLHKTSLSFLIALTLYIPLSCGSVEPSSAIESKNHNDTSIKLNDIHSALNETTIAKQFKPSTVSEIQEIIKSAKSTNHGISISGGKHAMGGQQFGENTYNIDMTGMNKILAFDPKKGTVTVEAGIEWPELIEGLIKKQANAKKQWSIRQKQTGADRLTIGGSLSANVHGRGLSYKPIVQDVESFNLVDADGIEKTCSRTENRELFRLAIGGYGLFGVITSVTLKLMPRTKLERVVKITSIDKVMDEFTQKIKQGYLYGDFQYSIDEKSENFLKNGVFSLYKPVSIDTPITEEKKELSATDWDKLYYLTHTDKKKAYDYYTKFYLNTNGQTYWSDINQLSVYIDNYHEKIDEKMHSKHKGSEMITEVYVPRKDLEKFMTVVREDLKKNHTNVIYGTVRLIKKDDESFLAWAKKDYAAIIFNLHVDHSEAGMAKAKQEFQLLIERALQFHGSYFLTYHRFATKQQVEKAYPQFVEFLKLKKKYDPNGLFQSEWYRHYLQMFAGDL